MPIARAPQGTIKFIIGWATVFGIRLLPFRAPNVEPVMATLMPFAKRYGAGAVFAFGFSSIFLFDLVTSGIGSWTWITAFAYGSVGAGAYFFFRNRAASSGNFLLYSVVATIAYDALTGLTIGPLFFGQPFAQALIGQVPFTILHLMGNMTLAIAVSPAIWTWVAADERFKIGRVRGTALAVRGIRSGRFLGYSGSNTNIGAGAV